MPMKVGLSTGRWNEQEFEIVLVGPAFLNRSTLSTLNFFFVNLDMCFFEWTATQIFQNISSKLLYAVLKFQWLLSNLNYFYNFRGL